ncbi:MAG: D-alanine--D-alanine ligase [Tannerella sp.]|jgi:D-alanine-D-alanine ligase|nr:D-alanine--D-alanine ligase [Tannerella sp.]
MKKNIAVIAGGYSSEYEVSLRSAETVSAAMDPERYNVYRVTLEKDAWTATLPDGTTAPVNRNDFSFPCGGEAVTVDCAYITVHGTPGEDGRLQGYLDMLRIPYRSCGVLASALTFNKFVCNRFLYSQGISVATAMRLQRGERYTVKAIVARLGGLPVFVKPNSSGSSFGISKVTDAAQMPAAIGKAFAEGDEVIIERFIPGREVTCGCYRVKGDIVTLPLTEVVTANEFFDYGAKYGGESQEITPAPLSGELTGRIRQVTANIYELIGARGLIRADYILHPGGAPGDGEPVLLEVNTTPGMTAASFIPQQIRAAGSGLREVLTDIIENG